MPERGVIDTSVVIDLALVRVDGLPDEVAVTAITLAELAAGPLVGHPGNTFGGLKDFP